MRFIFPLVLIVTFGCGLKQPVDPGAAQKPTGHIFVQSDTSGAVIFLDGLNTNKQTPDTLENIPTGLHTVSLYRDGFRAQPDSIRIEVMENRTSTVSFLLQKLILTGSFVITSMPAGAEIVINGSSTGKTTPDSITLEAGSYDIQIRKNGYKNQQLMAEVLADSSISLDFPLDVHKRILLESFANVSCEPCVEATEILEEFARGERFDRDNFAIIEYFGNWPLASDPFYEESPDHVDKRLEKYTIYTRGLPSLQIGGTEQLDPVDLDQIISVSQSDYTRTTEAIGISINKRLDENILNIESEIFNKRLDDTINLGEYSLFIAIIENDIQFDQAPGSNGLTHFNFVFRTFITGAMGEQLSTTPDLLEHSYQMSWPAHWSYENSRVIGFIQHNTNGEILQTTIN